MLASRPGSQRPLLSLFVRSDATRSLLVGKVAPLSGLRLPQKRCSFQPRRYSAGRCPTSFEPEGPCSSLLDPVRPNPLHSACEKLLIHRLLSILCRGVPKDERTTRWMGARPPRATSMLAQYDTGAICQRFAITLLPCPACPDVTSPASSAHVHPSLNQRTQHSLSNASG